MTKPYLNIVFHIRQLVTESIQGMSKQELITKPMILEFCDKSKVNVDVL